VQLLAAAAVVLRRQRGAVPDHARDEHGRIEGLGLGRNGGERGRGCAQAQGSGTEADEVCAVVGRSGGGIDDERDRGGVPAGVLAVVADDELGRVVIGGLDLPGRLAPLVCLVGAPVVAPWVIRRVLDMFLAVLSP